MKLLRLIMYIIFMFEIKRMDLQWITLYIGIEDSASLNSHLTSTDSGVWSEAPRGSGESASLQKGATHVRENSYGGSSGYGSLSSFPGGARPKLPPQVRELSQSLSDRFVGGTSFQVVKVDSGRVFILIITIGCHW